MIHIPIATVFILNHPAKGDTNLIGSAGEPIL